MIKAGDRLLGHVGGFQPEGKWLHSGVEYVRPISQGIVDLKTGHTVKAAFNGSDLTRCNHTLSPSIPGQTCNGGRSTLLVAQSDPTASVTWAHEGKVDASDGVVPCFS
ncbi:hypothetical protein CIHG_04847 [Coccidioides immitis H538.4]|uniref:Uncharacterized protein n=1 Tax=Coccidioides immitis H538.4 TaxID=396776 RepID=A0A0J8UHJ6_COCIT|nr:hypothetical protein CIHG_04847 [Coccidioides immitis H538.4]